MNTATEREEQDELLTLYFFNDGLSSTERRALEEAMADDAMLAARYAKISRDLSGIRAGDSPALPDDMLQRFHETIDRAARAEAMSSTQARSPRPVATFLFGAAAAAAVLVAVFAGLRVGSDIPSETVPMVVDVTPPIESNPASLKRSLQVYFRSGQQQLGDWPAASDSDRTSMIIALVGQNRRYEKLATQHEAADLARVLRAFEPILLRLAAEDVTAEESQRLRDQLAFELNVMLTKLTHEASEPARPLEQET
jgi:hypothetical protein